MVSPLAVVRSLCDPVSPSAACVIELCLPYGGRRNVSPYCGRLCVEGFHPLVHLLVSCLGLRDCLMLVGVGVSSSGARL